MTTLPPAPPAPRSDGEPAFDSMLVRFAGALGWTAGQAWTVLIGLLVAVPAAIFGLGPALDADAAAPGVVGFAQPAPAGNTVAAPIPAPPEPPPAILGRGTAPTVTAAPTVTRPPVAPPAPASGSGTASPTTTPTATPVTATPAPPAATTPATVPGPGTVRAIAAAADAIVATVDPGDGSAGRLVVLDLVGNVVGDHLLVVDGVGHQRPNGVAVTDDGVFVATADPAAVLRIDPVAGSITKLADLPDLPLCVPLARSSNCQPSVPDAGPDPQHVAAVGDAVYVSDRAQACIFRIGTDEGSVAAWLCDAELSASPGTEGSGLTGLAAASDRLLLTIENGIDGMDSVQVVAIDDGSPGPRVEIAALEAGSGASGVVLLPDGRAVVTLSGTSALLVIEADSATTRTVTLDGVTSPVDVDVVGDTLLVAHLTDGVAGTIAERPVSTL